MKRLFALSGVVIAGTLWSFSALAACGDGDLDQVENNIRWCGAQCGTSGHQQECNGNGYMGTHAQSGDANGVREGFEQCHRGADGEIGQMQACFRERPVDFLRRACNVYGCNHPAPPPPPPPPPPVVKKLEFKMPMKSGEAAHIVTADLTLEGTGRFKDISLNFTRDGKTVRTSTSALTFEQLDGGKIHITLLGYDPIVKNTSRHKYVVFGFVDIITP
jgi:hypothetical protein